MKLLLEKLETLLIQPTFDAASAIGEMRRLSKHYSGIESARAQSILRLCLVLENMQGDARFALDAAVLLRQVILSNQQRLRLHQNLWAVIDSHASSAGLRSIQQHESLVTIDAIYWRPDWLFGNQPAQVSTIESLTARRLSEQAIGDGLLFSMTAAADKPFTAYHSIAQKMAVELSLYAHPGSTTLITLPTGNGKSFCALLPAWFDSEGGQKAGGTTLVIVPTTALAEDQVQHANRYFTQAHHNTCRPYCWTSSTTGQDRAIICDGLENGTLPVLYTSPEALVSFGLGDMCLEAARKGMIRRLVIDEAHLVESWGAQFRIEFQLLSAYRQQLLAASERQLITLLLSATITIHCQALLTQLFSPDQAMTVFCANRLRPEITTWFHQARSRHAKEACILEALSHLPRPAILYTTLVEDAERLLRLLREYGFQRVASYTGQTLSVERTQILKQWTANELDIIVATSAFGVGVDKSDVRTVIHSALPENPDRYYQEIGRGGRDGNSAISLLCVTKDDIELSESMAVARRITPEKGWARWRGMWQGAQVVSGDEWALEMNAPPLYNPEIGDSERNQDWNAHTLMLMMRAGIIQILNTRLDPAAFPKPAYQRTVANPQWWKIRLLEPDYAADEPTFTLKFEAIRQHDFDHADDQNQRMKTILNAYKSNSSAIPDRCIAWHFAELYPNTGLACGGCAYCRQNELEAYCEPMHFTVDDLNILTTVIPSLHSATLQRQFGTRGILNSYYEPATTKTYLQQILSELLPILLTAGVQQFVLPDDWLDEDEWFEKLLKRFAARRPQTHRLLRASWLVEVPEYELFRLPSALVFPRDPQLADQVYHALSRYSPAIQPMLYILPRDLWLASQHGLFLDRVNGQVERLDQLKEMLSDEQDSVVF